MNDSSPLSIALVAALFAVACAGSVGGSGASGGASGIGGAGANTGGVSAGGSSNGGVVCGTTVCPSEQYCCNASCSMCAPRGAACIQIACSSTGGSGSFGVCTIDSDCSLYDDYCGGCNCRAVPANVAVDPACGPADMVSCVVEPCLNHTAACSNGRCEVAN